MKNKGKNKTSNYDLDKYYEMSSVASATECTGLTPALVKTEYEEDSYKEIYDVPSVEKKK